MLLEEKALLHQIVGAKQLAKVRRGILADDMGLGKTFTSILWTSYLDVDRLLVTAPKEVTSNLKEEIAKWTDRPIIDLRGMTKLRRETTIEAVRDIGQFIILINLEAWSRDKDLLSALITLQLQCLIIDEAHHINNTRTSAFKGVRELTYAANQCPDCKALVTPKYKCGRKDCFSGGGQNRFRHCMSCGHQQALVTVGTCECGTPLTSRLREAQSVSAIVVMTGTPILNSPGDLWPLLHLVDSGMFPSEKKYNDLFIDRLNNNKTIFKPGAQELLVTAMGNRYIQRSRGDAGISLPPQTIEVLEYDRDMGKYQAQWEAYENVETRFAIELEEKLVPITEIVVQITRLRQMITWPNGIKIGERYIDVGESQKLDIVHDKIKEYLSCGQRVVVFSHFKAPLRELERRLGNTSVVYDGSTPDDLRARIRKDFATAHAYPEWNVLLCNYRSTGESLTLIGATQAITLDEEWSPGKSRQAYRRIDRIGQKQETRVHIPRITQTVDTWLAKLNAFKEGMQREFHENANYQSEMLKQIRSVK